MGTSKIKKGDLVRVTIGKDKGREGKVDRVVDSGQAVVVAGLNQYKKHIKPQGENRPGEIVTLSRPLAMGKIGVICPKCKQITRVGFGLIKEKKVRVCRKCDQPID